MLSASLGVGLQYDKHEKARYFYHGKKGFSCDKSCDWSIFHCRLQGVVVSAGSLLRIPIGAHSCRGDLDEINNCSSLYCADTRKLYAVEAENKEERR
ncbi:hypothetical protein NC653_005037 [Populus alba x Populus x berolinensis]|uniref:Uncharacterized protein n=1 Tax=Populus alba x Populus x berolinensis TaxID=444605 RepID=A0AAD6RB00_9ROSI|nr:hypothetical protein NC653_005037 [Populus alba x Populus x berolinensis]